MPATAAPESPVTTAGVNCTNCGAPLLGHSLAAIQVCMASMVPAERIVGIKELVRLTGRPANRLIEYLAEPDAPEPLANLAAGRVYDADVAVPHILKNRPVGPKPKSEAGRLAAIARREKREQRAAGQGGSRPVP
jgi:hypothetical protein